MGVLPSFRLPREPVPSAQPWSLAHLRPALLLTGALAVVGGLVAALTAGSRQGLGVVVGLAVVASFFTVSAWAVARAGARDERLVLPAALGAYLFKLGLLGVVFAAIPDDGPIDLRWMAASVLVGLVVWTAAHLRFVLSRPQYYVDPPRPPQDSAGERP